MNTKHKHYDCITAWAEGKQIQFKNTRNNWEDINYPSWVNTTQYRIKPKEKKKMWQVLLKNLNGDFFVSIFFYKSIKEATETFNRHNITVINLLTHTEIEIEE